MLPVINPRKTIPQKAQRKRGLKHRHMVKQTLPPRDPHGRNPLSLFGRFRLNLVLKEHTPEWKITIRERRREYQFIVGFIRSMPAAGLAMVRQLLEPPFYRNDSRKRKPSPLDRGPGVSSPTICPTRAKKSLKR